MATGVTTERLRELAAPTPDEEKKTRPAPGGSGKMLTYIDARYVMDTLDRVCGPDNWQNQFNLDANGNLTCGIGILVARDDHVEWVWKWDVGTESTIEATKGNYSDAFKRAGVHWGIARDLYDERGAPAGSPTRPAGAGGVRTSAAGRATTAPLVSDWRCPIHGTYKVVPAGVSKVKRGKDGLPLAYPAFVVCAADGCEQKPPRGTTPRAPERGSAYVGMSEDLPDDGEFDGDDHGVGYDEKFGS